MKNSLLILAGFAALSLASCSQEKTTEVTTAPVATDGAATTTTTTTTTAAPLSDAAIEARAQRIADKMVANMKITDEATKTKIRTVYVNRYKRLSETRTKYATDTTGMAAAIREANTATDAEFKTVFADPTQYQAYESSRSTYDESNYANDNSSMSTPDNATSADAMSSGATTTPDNGTMSGTDNAMGATKLKAKAEDGSKIKIKENGKVKIKDADGTKMKN